ncbi:MAG: hypothetical protein R2991_14885 [Thermoanaerobaculia bacterium]
MAETRPESMARIVGEPVGRRRFVLLFVVPAVVLLLAAVWPLVAGGRTLYVRDFLNVHFEMKWTQQQAMERGTIPAVDLQRAGGQPHRANPNTVSFYPDNLLFLFASTFWAMNAHFWLHLFVALAAAWWMGRAFDLEAPAAWACAVVYAGSGLLLSTSNLYNLVAEVALAPALVAAMLEGGRGRPRLGFVATACIWALLLVGGDPLTAALIFAAALGAAATLQGRRAAWVPLGAGVVAGSLLAAPQWVELLRILETSFRGFQGFSTAAATVTSVHPWSVVEVLLPLPFRGPDFLFWGHRFHSNQIPLVFALYPGVVGLALALAAPWKGRRSAFGWGCVGLGLLLALGEHTPVVPFLLSLPGTGLLRLPVKFWLWVTLGLSVLAGLGVGSLATARGRVRLRTVLLAGALLYLGGWALLNGLASRVERWFSTVAPAGRFGTPFFAAERARWAGLCLLTLAVLALALGLVSLARRRPWWAAAGLLALHLAWQLFALRALVDTAPVEPLTERPPLADLIPEGSRVVHADHDDLFGPVDLPVGRYPDARQLWHEGTMHSELHPWSGVRWGWIYELDASPEGLDSFMTRAAAQALKRLPDVARIRLLRAAGVDYLLLTRDLDPAVGEAAPLVATQPGPGRDLRLYRIADPAPEVVLAGTVRGAPHMTAALERLLADDFEPSREVVLAGDVERRSGPPGKATVTARPGDGLEVAVESPSGGWLLVQRSYQSLYRATVDGARAAIAAADLHRLAIEVPPGAHRVILAVDLRPMRFALVLAGLGLAALLLGVRLLRSPASHEPRGVPEGPRRESR